MNGVACYRCQKRKRRCDKKFPRCSLCERNGCACLQKDPFSGQLYPRDHLNTLEREIKSYKETISQQKDLIMALRHTTQSNDQNTITWMQRIYSTFETNNGLPSLTEGNLEDEQQRVNHYLGFIDPLNKSLENEINQPLLGEQQPEKADSMKYTKLVKYLKKLPSVQFANYLFKIYFDKEYPIYPIIDQVETYANFYDLCKLKTSLAHNHNLKLDDDRISKALSNLYLDNLIFAIATSNLESSLKKEFIMSHPDYNRDYYLSFVFELAGLVLNSFTLIQKLQALVCLAQIALCRPCFPGLWNLSSILSSVVINFRLYDEAVYESIKDDIQRDLERRCFWAAYLIDRYVCLCISKPHLIDESAITTKYFSPYDDNDVKGSKQFSLFYIRYFRVMSQIDSTIYSSHITKILEELGIDKKQYLEKKKKDMLAQLDSIKHEVDLFVIHVANGSEFNAGYLTLLYYQAIFVLYKPRKYYPEPSTDSYKRLYDATKNIVELFKIMSDNSQLTYRILSVSSLFYSAIMYNCCVWKCHDITEVVDPQEMQQMCDDSNMVFGRISNFHNVDKEHTNRVKKIVDGCSSLLIKFTNVLLEYVKKIQGSSTDSSYDVQLGMEQEQGVFLGKDIDFDSPFSIVESLENIPWDKGID